jgi:uncharacterized protein with ParB-like and HNH nuclease domain
MNKPNAYQQSLLSKSQEAEQQIKQFEKIIDYDTKEFTVEIIVDKYTKDKDEDKNELFIPDYQREMAWDEKRQSKFIESVLIGLPIPFIFVADTGRFDGRLEIVDGSQRIRSLASFVNNQLRLTGLKKLTHLNGSIYSDLEIGRQRRFNRKTIRLIELSNKADEEVRRDMFERINTGSVELTDMEKRRGVSDGWLVSLLEECASIQLFKDLAPLSTVDEDRREREELILRFFAYFENYKNFDRSVRDFLNEYVDVKQRTFKNQNAENEKIRLKLIFEQMLHFVKTHFQYGFRKNSNHTTTPRVRFEVISVGSALALADNPNLRPNQINTWLNSSEFKSHTTSDGSNSRPRLINRIEYVKDRLLESHQT